MTREEELRFDVRKAARCVLNCVLGMWKPVTDKRPSTVACRYAQKMQKDYELYLSRVAELEAYLASK